ISCPFEKTLNLKHVDHIFTLFKPHYDYFKSIGKSATLTQAAFDDEILPHLETKQEIELSFVGGIGGYHYNRKKLLRYLIKRTPLKIWGYGFKSKNRIKNLLKQILSGFVYTKPYQGEAWGKEMLEVLYNSKITFNSHGDIAIGHAVN